MVHTNYSKYKLTKRAYIQYGCIYIVGAGIVGWLFYDSWFVGMVFLLGLPIYYKLVSQMLNRKRKTQLKLDFREMMTVMYSMINAGYSLESSLKGAPKELRLCCDPDSDVLKELDYMIAKMKVNVTAMSLLEDFAKRSGDSDIQNFYEIISIAKHYGGSMSKIIHTSISKINERIEIWGELETMIAAKKHEFMIMMIIPLGMIGYMRLGSPEMMSVLYVGLVGRIIMSIALVVYGIAILWGQRIVDIRM